MKAPKEQLEVIRRGVVELISEKELLEKFERARREERPLRVKLGVDPTASDLHLGHTVVLTKLRQFQDLGHQAILIIGDFTARIGDPTGQKKTRPQLTPDEIQANARTYLEQVAKLLELQKVEMRHNSEWLGRLGFEEVLKLCARFTVARMIERDTFAERMKAGVPIGLHELFYPMMQAYDSVAVEADVELGGTDQTFNLLVARDLQRELGQEPQVAVTTPILVGTDGVQRMGKSLGNYIGVTEEPFELFSKVMSLPDEVMRDYFVLTTPVAVDEIERLFAAGQNPRDTKLRLGQELVTKFHGAPAADETRARWEQVFSRRQLPDELPELELASSELKEGRIWAVGLVRKTGYVHSNSEARRLIEQGGVSLDENKITAQWGELEVRDGMILRVGKKKRYFRIRIR